MSAMMPVGGTVVLVRDAPDGIEVLLIRRPDRGSFANGWVFPGGVVEPVDARPGDDEARIAANAAARECEEEVGVRPHGLQTISCWVPPIEAPKRVRTWFFLAPAPDGEQVLAADEVADARWLSPEAALAAHAVGEIVLFPPTWVTLNALSGAPDAETVLGGVDVPELYATHLVGDGVFVWGGDAGHPEGGEGRHRLDTASLPWSYVRD
ncbi:NUDIX hydrolase [Microbacterium sp. GXF6406]